ncbi:ribosomal protein S18-alanine N-acetyltransferase [Shewanella sp. OMA3-2]|nr:ribosomal protein S18-alanine N-acetyltransferase [Shewanella sp. OMA3-2]UJF23474.1 ribosomal protein S18-alanine N-acetyltransferase [Shewanella sp. OMA3-2]
MFVIESSAYSHPLSLANLQDCFGYLYRVEGLFDGDQLLGFSIVQQVIDEVTLIDICVNPAVQGKGLGKRLLTSLVAQAKALNAVVVMLEVRQSNMGAIGLYEKAGFVESGRRKGYYSTDDGHEDAILMDLALG